MTLNGEGYSDRELDESDYHHSWPLTYWGLDNRMLWLWFDQLWEDVCLLRRRYRLMVRSGWWEDDIQVEALAALVAWTQRYDARDWDDPPGKLALLYDLQRVAELLRGGLEPFNPGRDRARFDRYLLELGGRPP